MATRWIYASLLACLLSGCGAWMNSFSMDEKMRQVKLGMTKEEVIRILGKEYEQAGARQTPYGTVESISYLTQSYVTDNSDGYYILSFRDGRLVEWFKDKNTRHPHPGGKQP